MVWNVGIVGVGNASEDSASRRYAMGYRHAAAYRRIDGCELVGCADVERKRAEEFADRFDIPANRVYESHEELLCEASPDIVSVCVPPKFHANIVIDCARSGVVEAVHCEKPMATTWGDCKAMVRACDHGDVSLTINHQRRFGRPFQLARDSLDSGDIGDLVRLEVGGNNLFDYGTHLFDLCGYYTGQASAAWVLAGIDYSTENRWHGTHNENQAVVKWKYENGVSGFASTGEDRILPCQLRLIGTEGVIDIGHEGESPLRIDRHDGEGWEAVDTGEEGIHGRQEGVLTGISQRLHRILPGSGNTDSVHWLYVDRAIRDVVRSLQVGTESQLAATNALDATELIFASWESARRRGRVELPLDIYDNPLKDMIASGQLSPE